MPQPERVPKLVNHAACGAVVGDPKNLFAADAVRLAMRGKYADARASAARVEGAAPWDARLHIGAQFARALAWMGEGDS